MADLALRGLGNLKALDNGDGTLTLYVLTGAGTALIGKVGIDQTTPGTTDSVSVKASGIVASATFTPAAAAYGAADIMDVAKEFSFTYAASGLAVPAASLIRILTSVIKIDVTSVPAGQTSYSLQLYGATPPSAQADNDAWTLASGDLSLYTGSIDLGTPADKGAALYVKKQYIDFDLALGAAKTSLFGQLVTDGAHTAAAVARTVLLRGVVL